MACNLILGNEPGQLLDGGTSSGNAGGPVDASADGSPATVDASASDDAGSGDRCLTPAAPTHPCFDDGSCSSTVIATQRPGSDGGRVGAYPHDLARGGEYLYYSAQERTVPGRNNNGIGELFRVRATFDAAPEQVSPADGLSASATAIRDGFLFWRTWNAANGQSAIHRLELARWAGGTPCTDVACGHESVAIELPGRVNELWAVSSNEVYARLDNGLRLFVKEGQWSSRTLSPSIEETKGRLREGSWTGWRPGTEPAVSGYMTLYSLRAGQLPRARASWVTPPGASAPIPFESSLIATRCEETFLYEQWATPPLRRVDLDAGIDAPPERTFSPIDCPACEPALTFSHVADARFSYLALPNDGGLLAIEHEGGSVHKLVTGDAWDVVVDDDAVYYTNVDGLGIGRIDKR